MGGVNALVVGGEAKGAHDVAGLEAGRAKRRAARDVATLLVRLLGRTRVIRGGGGRTGARAAAAVVVVPGVTGTASGRGGRGLSLRKTAVLVVGPVPVAVRGRARLAGSFDHTIRKAIRWHHEVNDRLRSRALASAGPGSQTAALWLEPELLAGTGGRAGRG